MYWRVEQQWTAPRPRGMQFSSHEIVQILMAVGALTLAFTIAQTGGVFSLGVPGGLTGPYLAFAVLASFVAVITAFLLHELAHKALAQRYGCYAEFRAFPMGLLLGIITAFLGFLFAAPGAVMISGPVGPRENAKISAVGPGTNFAVAGVFLAIAFVIGSPTSWFADLTIALVGSVAFVNLFLGGFNMVPFPPLDGSKIFAYNKPLWAGMVAVLVALGLVAWQLHLL